MIILLALLAHAAEPQPFDHHWPERDTSQRSMASRAAVIVELERLLASGSGLVREERAELLLRLANMQLDQASATRMASMADWDAKMAVCTVECDLQPDLTESHGWQIRAVATLNAFLADFRDTQRADEALYWLIEAHGDLGEPEPQLAAAKALLQEHPDSEFAPYAWVAAGDAAFDRNEGTKAASAYRHAMATPGPMNAWATFRYATTIGQMDRQPEAIDTLEALVERGEPAAGSLDMRDEALAALVGLYADTGDADRAFEFFDALGRPDLAHQMLAKLADQQAENGDWRGSITTRKRIIADAPNAADAPHQQARIVAAARSVGDPNLVAAEANRLATTYGPGSAWAGRADPGAKADADNEIEGSLRELAVTAHERYRRIGKSAGSADAKLAGEAYEAYLRAYPTGAHAAEIHYDYAELLYATGQLEAAYDHYTQVLALDPNGPHSLFCAESAIFAADAIVRKDASQATPSADGPPEPLSTWEERLVAASDRYRTMAQGDKTQAYTYRSAYVLYRHRHFAEAGDRFLALIEADPTAKDAVPSAHLVLDGLASQRDWAAVASFAARFSDTADLGDATFDVEVTEIRARALFQQIDDTLAVDHDPARAADALVQLALDIPTAEIAPQALGNAAVHYRSAGQLDDAIRADRLLLDDPRFDAADKRHFEHRAALAFDLETLARFEEAAPVYESVFAHRTDVPDTAGTAADALWSAAVLRDALGQPEVAIEDYTAFVTAFPADPRIVAAQLGAARLQTGKPAAAAYAKALTLPATPAERLAAHLGRGEALAAIDPTGARLAWQAGVREYEALDPEARAAASAPAGALYLHSTADRLEAYLALDITLPKGSSPLSDDDNLRRGLAAKVRALQAIEADVAAVVATGDGAAGIEALERLGVAYEDFAATLEDAPVPRTLTADQADGYADLVGDKVYGQRERAADAYVSAVETSKRLSVGQEPADRARLRLSVLRPDEWPITTEILPEPGYLSEPARPIWEPR